MNKIKLRSYIIFFSVLVLIGLAVLVEQLYLEKTFAEFYRMLETVEAKVQNDTATRQDAENLHDFWEKKKKTLHVVIPHAEIKEVESPLSELKVYIDEKDKTEALAKLEYLKDLAEMIPEAFDISLGNVF